MNQNEPKSCRSTFPGGQLLSAESADDDSQLDCTSPRCPCLRLYETFSRGMCIASVLPMHPGNPALLYSCSQALKSCSVVGRRTYMGYKTFAPHARTCGRNSDEHHGSQTLILQGRQMSTLCQDSASSLKATIP